MRVKGAFNDILREGLAKICREEGIVRVPIREQNFIKELLVKVGWKKRRYERIDEFPKVTR